MGKFELMALPYAMDALEPVISKQTLEFHHGKHLAGYVNNLNGLLEGSPLAGLPLEEIVLKAEGGLLNNAGQILNHNLYFGQFTAPKADNAPKGKLAEAIVRGRLRHSRRHFRRVGQRCLALAGYGCRLMLMATWSSRRSKGHPILW